MSSMPESEQGLSGTPPLPTAGPLEVGYYALSKDFKSIPQHLAVMRPDGGLMALVGPADDPQSLVDAHMFKATPALLNACQLAFSLLRGHSPAVDQAVEEALGLARVPAES